MVVIVIISILAMVAYPNYKSYAERSKRIEAQTVLHDISNKLVAYGVTNNNFRSVNLNTLYGTKVPSAGTTNYNLSITDGQGVLFSDNNSDVNTWRLTAVPINSMSGTGSLTLDSTGRQCWEKTSGACEPWDGK